ncbi:hypothetical protein ACHAQJ_010660 [Trichoderma viride]
MWEAKESIYKGQPGIELENRSASNSNSSIRKRSLDRDGDSAIDTDSDGELVDGEEHLPLHESDPMGEPAAAAPRSASTSPRYVVAMCAMFIFMVELSMYVTDPAMQMIMEDVACHDHYPDHKIGVNLGEDSRCKNADVQGTLAMSRSWMMWAQMLVPLLVQIPYGIVADNYGRRPVLFLGLFGNLLGSCWTIIVLLNPTVFSIWYLVLSALPNLIGGGGSVIIAMVWTILADAISPEKRTFLFYQMHAMMLILSIIFRPIAGWMLSINPWLSMWTGLGSLAISTCMTLLIPETLHLSQSSSGQRANGQASHLPPLGPKQSVIRTAWSTAKKDASRVWQLLQKSKNLLPVVLTLAFYSPIHVAFEMNMLQYITKRFDWDWSKATYFMTIPKITSAIVLLVMLPTITWIVNRRLHLDILTRDLYFSRGSIICILAGNALTVIASTPWLLAISLITLGFGTGLQPQIRAILASLVEAHALATVNTAIASAETMVNLVGTPVLGWLLSKGIALGGFWMGLPYLATTLCAIGSCIAIFIFRIPPQSAKSDEEAHYDALRTDDIADDI